MNWAELSECVSQTWTPQIGDPGMTGWLTVLAYLLCSALAIAVVFRLPRKQARGFWTAIAAVTLFLAVNKQLDLQTALTAAGRCLSHAQGWYGMRRLVQLAFMALLLAGTVLALRRGKRALKGNLRRNRLALWGVTILAAFVMLRAVGFHFFDVLIGIERAGLSVNFVFENAGLLLIAANAVGHLRRGQDAPAAGRS